MTMLKNIEAKTYTRNDLETTDKRVRYIAQHVQQFAPPEFTNLTAQISEDILGLDYSRVGSPILWTICRKQQEDIENLTNRILALETPKTKTAKAKKPAE